MSARDWHDLDDVFLPNAEHRRRAELLLRSVRLTKQEEADDGTTLEAYGPSEDDRDDMPGTTAIQTGIHLLAALTHAVLALGVDEPAVTE